MPAFSDDQRKAAGVALAVKRGEKKKEELRGASEEMYHSLSEGELEDLATKRTGKDNGKDDA